MLVADYRLIDDRDELKPLMHDERFKKLPYVMCNTVRIDMNKQAEETFCKGILLENEDTNTIQNLLWYGQSR